MVEIKPTGMIVKVVSEKDKFFELLNNPEERIRFSSFSGGLEVVELLPAREVYPLLYVSETGNHGWSTNNEKCFVNPKQIVYGFRSANPMHVDKTEETKPEGLMVLLTYFKQSGKYYSEGQYVTKKTEMFHIFEEVKKLQQMGKLPGLIEGAKEFYVHVNVPDHENNVPMLLAPINESKQGE